MIANNKTTQHGIVTKKWFDNDKTRWLATDNEWLATDKQKLLRVFISHRYCMSWEDDFDE